MTHQPHHFTAGYAKIAGLLYLLIAVVGAFSIAYVPSQIIVNGDAKATAQALLENAGLFRLGLLGDSIVIIAEIILTAMLYVMFRPISPTLSMVAAFARLSMIMVMAINMLINAMPLVLHATLEGQSWVNLTTTLFAAHQYGVYVWGILFGLHLLALGYLVVKSGYFPQALGWMMGVGAFGYAFEGIAKITSTQNETLSILTIALLVLVTIGELSFALWLLIKGPNTKSSG